MLAMAAGSSCARQAMRSRVVGARGSARCPDGLDAARFGLAGARRLPGLGG